VAVSPDGANLAAVGEQNGILAVWNLRSDREVYVRDFPTDLGGGRK
jgi:hypothetical protein